MRIGTSMDRTTPSMTLCPKWIFEYDRFVNMLKAARGGKSWVFIPNQNIIGGVTWWLTAKSFDNDRLCFIQSSRVPLRARNLFICTIDSKIKFTVFHTCALTCIPLFLIWEHKPTINKEIWHFEQYSHTMAAKCLYGFHKVLSILAATLAVFLFFSCWLIFTSVQSGQIKERIQ